MEKIMTWYRLWLKLFLKKKSTWLLLLAMGAALYLLGNARFPDGAGAVGLCGGGRYARQVMAQLMREDGAFHFVEYQDPEQLREDILRGKADSGFLFPETFDASLQKGELSGCVTCIVTPFSVRAELVRETVYAGIFRVYSGILLAQSVQELYGLADAERTARILALNRKYQDGKDVFQLEIRRVGQKPEPDAGQAGAEARKKKGVVGLFLFLLALLSAGNVRMQEGRAASGAMSRRARFVFAYAGILAAVTPAALAGLAYLAFSGAAGNLLYILYIFYCILWTDVCSFWMAGSGRYASWILALSVANLFICPIFWDLSEYIGAVRYVRLLFPLGIYLGCS